MTPRHDEVGRSGSAIRSRIDPPRLDVEIARIGERQSGVVARDQLLAIGVSASGVTRRLAAGRLHRLRTGVYAVGHPRLDQRGRRLAAVLACGPGAVLSHRSAAALWDLARADDRVRHDVTVANRSGRRSPPGIILHRVRALAAEEVCAVDEIPCTTVARTLVDLAGACSPRDLERACERAEMLRLFDMRELERSMRRSRGRRGAHELRSLLSRWRVGSTFTRSGLEERFLALVRAARLPPPQLNAIVLLGDGRHVEVDALWQAQRLVVELDGREVHGTRAAFENDRARDTALLLAGYRIARFTWLQMTQQADWIAQTVAALLAGDDGSPPRRG